MDTLKDKLIQIICEVYQAKYLGYLDVKYLEPFGIDVALGLNNKDRPIHIAGQLYEDAFLKYFREELRNRHLDDLGFFEAYQLQPYDPTMNGPIDRNKTEEVQDFVAAQDVLLETNDSYKIWTSI